MSHAVPFVSVQTAGRYTVCGHRVEAKGTESTRANLPNNQTLFADPSGEFTHNHASITPCGL